MIFHVVLILLEKPGRIMKTWHQHGSFSGTLVKQIKPYPWIFCYFNNTFSEYLKNKKYHQRCMERW